MTLGVSACVTLLAFPLYRGVSPWFGLAAFVVTATLINMALASRFCLPMPHLAFFVALLQSLLGPWLAYYYPSDLRSSYNIGAFLPDYLAFAGPACLAFGAGLLIPVALNSMGRLHRFHAPSHVDKPHLQRELSVLFWVGLAAHLGAKYAPANLAFLAVLLEDLMFVAVLMEMLMGLPQWGRHGLIALFVLVASTFAGGTFHKLILWLTIAGFLFALRYRWKWRAVLVVLIGFVLVLILQQVKVAYRLSSTQASNAGLSSQLEKFGASAGEILGKPETIVDESAIAATAVRVNQGWIVALAMKHVPEVEPFCYGETIKAQVIGLLVPRFVMPTKYVVANNAEFTRFTGRKLTDATTMTLGYLGEMYVNFGVSGGILAVGCYGLLLGLGFVWLYRQAQRSSLWWAWLPFLAVEAVKSEDTVGYATNWIVKATVVMMAVIILSPTMRIVLRVRAPTPEEPEPLLRPPGMERAADPYAQTDKTVP